MAELLSPGIFIEERTSQLQQINAVSTSNFGTVGWTPRGVENVATLVTSLDQFFRTFGSFTLYSNLAYGIAGYFQNGGARAYVVRVTATDALAAYASFDTNFKFTAKSRGAWGNLVKVAIQGNENYYDVATATFSRFDVLIYEESTEGAADYSVIETFEAVSLSNENDSSYIVSVINDENTGSNEVTVTKLNGGIPVEFDSVLVSNESIATGDSSQQLFTHTLASPVIATDTLKININGILTAVDDGSGNLEAVSGGGVTGTLDYDTGALTIFFVAAPALGATITADYYTAGDVLVSIDLTNGSDGTPANIGRSQVSASSLATSKKGIYAFDNVDEFLNIALVDWSGDKTISLDLISYCKNRTDCFAVIDCAEGMTAQQAVRYKRSTLGSISDFGAIYWPRVKVADELRDNASKIISSVGHIVGCYARTDIQKNVGKTPAGVDDGQLYGIQELEYKGISKGERDILYPAGINPLREDAYVGRCIWGGKTLAITGDFTRINARRLFIFLEKSVFGSTHDLVFENISTQLWAKIKLRLDGFLLVLFEEGYFRGDSAESAFRVIVDESNNPPEVVNARQVITDILISVNEPGEYVRFRYTRMFPNT